MVKILVTDEIQQSKETHHSKSIMREENLKTIFGIYTRLAKATRYMRNCCHNDNSLVLIKPLGPNH